LPEFKPWFFWFLLVFVGFVDAGKVRKKTFLSSIQISQGLMSNPRFAKTRRPIYLEVVEQGVDVSQKAML
jgi:hypothetical protein